MSALLVGCLVAWLTKMYLLQLVASSYFASAAAQLRLQRQFEAALQGSALSYHVSSIEWCASCALAMCAQGDGQEWLLHTMFVVPLHNN